MQMTRKNGRVLGMGDAHVAKRYGCRASLLVRQAVFPRVGGAGGLLPAAPAWANVLLLWPLAGDLPNSFSVPDLYFWVVQVRLLVELVELVNGEQSPTCALHCMEVV